MSANAFTANRRQSRPVLVGVGANLLLWLLAALVIVLALVIGGSGADGLWSDAIVQLVSLFLLAFVLASIAWNHMRFGQAWPAWIVAAALLLPILQLLPLPPAIWTHLPGRDEILAAYRAATIDLPWLPISLDPGATLRAFLSLIPPVAIFFAAVNLGPAARRSLTLLVIAVGVLAVLVGFGQAGGGGASSLRLYPITDSGGSEGFFANRNHQAALLYSLLPFTAAWVLALLAERGSRRTLALWTCAVIYAALLLGLGMTFSRAGSVLAVAAALCSLAMAARTETRFARRSVVIVGVATIIGVFLVLQYAFTGLVARTESDPLNDLRIEIARNTIVAGEDFQPLGSGFGTFVPVYQMFEPASDLDVSYVNHAHDDWLELWLEGGWAAVAILLVFVGWFVISSIRVWRRSEGDRGSGLAIDRLVPQAASIVIMLLMMHSVVDYPLRTTALSTLFGFCCALLVPPEGKLDELAAVGALSNLGTPRKFSFRFPGRRNQWSSGR